MNNYTNLPMIGRIQHGEKEGNKVKELGYFIAKIQDEFMQNFLQKFDEQFKGKKYIEVEFCDDNPLSKKYVRFNQSGEVCKCFEGTTEGQQKVKNVWQPIECNQKECQHRQKNASGKSACNRIGWLKFFIPSVCQDRIWLMKITGQTSINRIDSYINLQKAQGNSLKGRYILFLKQEQQTSQFTGQTYSNYVLDIVKKEDFILSNQIPETTKNQKNLSTKSEKNVNNNVEKEQPAPKKATVTQNAEKAQPQESKEKKKTTPAATSKKSEEKKIEKITNIEPKSDDDKTYVLLKTFTETITNKGQSKEYLMGEFCNMKDEIFNIAIKPEFADDLSKCELGTPVKLDVKAVNDKLFALNLEYIKDEKIAA